MGHLSREGVSFSKHKPRKVSHMSLLLLFCHVHDFWKRFSPQWHQDMLANGAIHRVRAGKLSPSEIMTIMIHFHQSRYQDFKSYYTRHVQVHLRSEFPELVSYERFVQLMPSVLVPLCAYMCISCELLRSLHRHKLHRLDSHRCVPQQTHPQPPRLRRHSTQR